MLLNANAQLKLDLILKQIGHVSGAKSSPAPTATTASFVTVG